MPELPDLRAKVKLDWASLDAAEVKARAFGASLKRSLGDNSTSLGDFERGLRRVDTAAEDASEGAARFGLSTNGLSLGTSAAGPALIGLAAAAVAVTLALGPTVELMGAFTVGLAGALTVMTLGIGGFAALAAGAVILAAATGHLGDASGKGKASAADLAAAQSKLAVAQQKYGASSFQAAQAQEKLNALQAQGVGPLASLKEAAMKAADALGQQAAPAALQVLGTVRNLIGPIEQLASKTLSWFDSNQRLGRSLGLLSGFANDTFQVLDQRLGPSIGRFLDSFLARGSQFDSLWRQVLGKAADATDGLLTNLLRLSDWFTARLPTLGPLMGNVFGGIGDIVQGLGSALGRLTDWLTPVVAKTQEWWPAVEKASNDVHNLLQPAMDELASHSGDLQNVLAGVAIAIGALAVTAFAVAFTIPLATAAVFALTDQIDKLQKKLDGLNAGTSLGVLGQYRDQTWTAWTATTAFNAAVLDVIATFGKFSVGPSVGGLNGVRDAAWSAFVAISTFNGSIERAISDLSAKIGVGGVISGFSAVASAAWAVFVATTAADGALLRLARDVASNPITGGATGAALRQRQAGGPVVPGHVYTVGEAGPETLVMTGGGGFVIPNAGGGSTPAATGAKYSIVINISGAGNPAAVAAAVDARLSQLLTQT